MAQLAENPGEKALENRLADFLIKSISETCFPKLIRHKKLNREIKYRGLSNFSYRSFDEK